MGSPQFSCSRFFRDVLAGLAGALLLALGALPVAAAPPAFGPASPLSSSAATDAAIDAPPVLATGRNGTWIAAWESNDSLGGTIGTDSDVLFVRSADDGATWSATAALDPLAASDSAADRAPAIASDGHGTWVVVWSSNRRIGTTNGDLDILFSRSTDDGVTWSAADVLNAQLLTDTRADDQPTIAADGHGGWVVAWRAIVGDADIYAAHSVDGGATWSAPAPLNQNAASDLESDHLPALATDGSGAWIAVWTSNDSLGGTIGSDQDILYARSSDGGLSWTPPRAVHSNAGSDSGTDTAPAIAADGRGGWLVAWQSSDSLGGTIGVDFDIVAVRSSDGGVSWSAPAPVNSYAATDVSNDAAPSVSCSAPRRCAVAWHSNDSLGNTIGIDLDVLLATTEDGGATWAPAAALDPRARLDGGGDLEAVLVADGRGPWMATWQSTDSFGGTIGTDFDPLIAVGLEPPVCGDGVLHSQELCDDGNTLPGDGCRADCTPEVCGDGILDPSEACDDGNGVDGDGCRADCSAEVCGDGIVDANEACDDGNASNGDGCDAACYVETAPAPQTEPPAPTSLLDFFDASVADGTLVGTGNRHAARERLRMLRWWLDRAMDTVVDGRGRGACAPLSNALRRVDGLPRPRDFAQGPAAPELARRIEALADEVGCHAATPSKPHECREDGRHH